MSFSAIITQANGDPIRLDTAHRLHGGTAAVSEGSLTPEEEYAAMDITYNYAPFYGQVWPAGLRALDGMRCDAAILEMARGCALLGTDCDGHYFHATQGNAGKALADLLALTALCPSDAILRIS